MSEASGTVILASASPRRLDLLRQIGLRPAVRPVSVDETVQAGEQPTTYVQRLARAKAETALAAEEGAVVIGADTAVVLGRRILGKPVSREAALRNWRRMAGRWHTVVSGFWVCDAARGEGGAVSTRVHCRSMAPAEAEAYWATGEPRDKAGGYAIQGRGAVFMDRIQGSYSNVVGLPLAELAAVLAGFGVSIWEQP